MSTHGPIQKEAHGVMNALARLLSDALKPFGFALLVFPFGDNPKGRMNYISNAQRADMIIAMKEFIARSEGFDVDTPDTKQ